MYKVLIVEDDPMVAMINEQYIKRNKNFTVVGKCKDGRSAISFLEANEVDLMILDVYMPLMNGFEALRAIRNKNISVDVIMVTAANDRDSLEEALHLGIVDYLVKPFTVDRFGVALDKFIAQHNALRGMNTLDQSNIDYIIDNSHRKSEELYPKGIQEKTLETIMEYLTKRSGEWLTGEAIADGVNISVVTVRRYMSYLSDSGKVLGDMDYETGGRPCMKYQMK